MRDIGEAIRTGKLPNRMPSHIWGGFGTGAACMVCDRPVTADETEVEFELDPETERGPAGPTYRMHTDCYRAWQLALPVAS